MPRHAHGEETTAHLPSRLWTLNNNNIRCHFVQTTPYTPYKVIGPYFIPITCHLVQIDRVNHTVWASCSAIQRVQSVLIYRKHEWRRRSSTAQRFTPRPLERRATESLRARSGSSSPLRFSRSIMALWVEAAVRGPGLSVCLPSPCQSLRHQKSLRPDLQYTASGTRSTSCWGFIAHYLLY